MFFIIITQSTLIIKIACHVTVLDSQFKRKPTRIVFHFENKKSLPRPGYCHIRQVPYLLFTPPFRIEPVQADDKDAGIVEPLHAVDGRDRHALCGHIV